MSNIAPERIFERYARLLKKLPIPTQAERIENCLRNPDLPLSLVLQIAARLRQAADLLEKEKTGEISQLISLYLRATDSNQYDSQDNNWSNIQQDLNSPYIREFWYYLKSLTETWKNKDLLEIGCGSGWLLDLALQHGATSATGIESAKRNSSFAQRNRPTASIIYTSFEEFDTTREFDIILAIMVVPHISDLFKMFSKCQKLLKDSGEVQMVVPDFDYFKTPRFQYNLQWEKVDAEEYVALVNRASGKIADIVRGLGKYSCAAQQNGFWLASSQPMPPTLEFREACPQYEQFKGQPLTHLLVFKKV